MIKNFEGFQTYEEVQKSIQEMGNYIGNGDGTSKSVNIMRIALMRTLLDLFERYTNTMRDKDKEWTTVFVKQECGIEKYFFSTDHCQPDIDIYWIPITRSCTKEETIKRYYKESVEVMNPNPEYQA